MENKQVTILLCIDSKIVNVPLIDKISVEQIIIEVCKKLGIGPLARHLFSLRIYNSKIWLPLNAELTDNSLRYEFRIRYKVPNFHRLKKIDIKAYDYYFQQSRFDVRNYMVTDLVYDNVKKELLGLGVADMYRVMKEKELSVDAVLNDYKKFISKEVIKHHPIFFIKKPIRQALEELKKRGHDSWIVKRQYLEQLESMAPEYLTEEYNALIDRDRVPCRAVLRVSPYNKNFPGICVSYGLHKKEWNLLSTIEDLCFVSISNDGIVQISRKSGIPTNLKFESLQEMHSFVSLIDGYYRFMIKWTFNLCKEIYTPTLDRLLELRCHGPVGGEFSYAKLEEKTQNRRGCYILRESELKYNVFYIDVCIKDKAKPKTYKLEKIGDEEYIFNDDVTRYKNIFELRKAYNKPENLIYLNECLPPSEYDISPVLLCLPDDQLNDSYVTDSDTVNAFTSSPVIINPKNLQVYKGTGNDYMGTVSMTRSNRTCQKWTVNTPHTVNSSFLNKSLYAELDIEKAENYCRNPSRSIASLWCYTLDPLIPFDLCNIQDCRKEEESIVLTKGNGFSRNVYIYPQWKQPGPRNGLHFALKQWDPDKPESILFAIFPRTGIGMYFLYIGCNNNEKVELYYAQNVNSTQRKLLKSKTLPNLILIGKWSEFWLRVSRDNIQIGYEGFSTAFFEWFDNSTVDTFEPVFLTYMSLQGSTIGVSFPFGECHTEKTYIREITRLLPIGWGRSDELNVYNNLTLYLRGSEASSAKITLILYPEQYKTYFILYIGKWFNSRDYFFVLVTANTSPESSLKVVKSTVPLFTENSWTKFEILFNETDFIVMRNNELRFHYSDQKHKTPFVFYWFSVGADPGPITWSANCIPVDIDGPSIDGGWSSWQSWECTVSCGGGVGYRKRVCDNPRPNVFGRMCEGRAVSSGRCNEFQCGDISTQTLFDIHEHLQNKFFSYEMHEDDKFLIENFNEIIEKIRTESPKAEYIWTFNGFEFKSDSNRIDLIGNDILISKLHPNDSGVYMCVLHRINGDKIIFHAVSLAVIPKDFQIITRATYKVELNCRSVILAYLYTDLSQKWTINNETYKDYGTTSLPSTEIELVKMKKTYTGTWKCIISQEDLNFIWTTNILKILVKSKPTFFTHLMEDEFPSYIFGWLKYEWLVEIVFFTLIILTFVLTFFVVRWYRKFMTLPRQKYIKVTSK